MKRTRSTLPQRHRWIKRTLAAGGRVTRRALIEKFGVSKSVAWATIRGFRTANPAAMTYCDSTKTYKAVQVQL